MFVGAGRGGRLGVWGGHHGRGAGDPPLEAWRPRCVAGRLAHRYYRRMCLSRRRRRGSGRLPVPIMRRRRSMASRRLAAWRRYRLVLLRRRTWPRRGGLASHFARSRLAADRGRCRLARSSLARLGRGGLPGGCRRALASLGDRRRPGPGGGLFYVGLFLHARLCRRPGLCCRPCRLGRAGGRLARRLGHLRRRGLCRRFLRRGFHGRLARPGRCRLGRQFLRRLAALGCRCSGRLGPRRRATRSVGFSFRLHFVRAQTTIVLRHILSPCIGRGGRVL